MQSVSAEGAREDESAAFIIINISIKMFSACSRLEDLCKHRPREPNIGRASSGQGKEHAPAARDGSASTSDRVTSDGEGSKGRGKGLWFGFGFAE